MTGISRSCGFVTAAALSWAVLLAGCGRRESVANRAAREGRYLMVLSADPQTMDPHISTGVPEYQVAIALFEGLCILDPVTCEPRPGAAEKWDVSPDGLIYTFHLRPEGRWSNGDPVTAEDFVYSVQRVLTPALAAEYASLLYVIKNARAFNAGEIKDPAKIGVRAVDARTVEFTLEYPAPYFPALQTHQALMPVHRASVEKYGRFDDHSSPWAKPGRIIGNGPFILQSWQTSQRIVVVKNPMYRDAKSVHLNAVEFLPMENRETADRSFRAGQVHVTDTLPLSRIPVYQAEKTPEFVMYPYLGTGFLSLNVKKAPLTDPRVRRALSLALDRKALVERVTRGGYGAAQSFTPPGTAGFQPPLAPISDAAQARRLLAETGFPGGKGFPELEGTYPTADTTRVMLEAMQEMWRRELGITVRITNVEWKVFLDSLSKRDYQIGFMSWIGDYIDPNTFLTMMLSKNGNNRTEWASPAYDALLDKADRTLDQAARYQLLGEAEKMLAEEEPIIPVWHLTRTFLLHKSVRGFSPNLLDMHPYQYLWLEPAGK